MKHILKFFHVKGQCPSTIEKNRAALADALNSDSLYVSCDEALTYLVTSFHGDRPKASRVIPKWKLSLVLHMLTHAPFEPMCKASLKHLTLKRSSSPCWPQITMGVKFFFLFVIFFIYTIHMSITIASENKKNTLYRLTFKLYLKCPMEQNKVSGFSVLYHKDFYQKVFNFLLQYIWCYNLNIMLKIRS